MCSVIDLVISYWSCDQLLIVCSVIDHVLSYWSCDQLLIMWSVSFSFQTEVSLDILEFDDITALLSSQVLIWVLNKVLCIWIKPVGRLQMKRSWPPLSFGCRASRPPGRAAVLPGHVTRQPAAGGHDCFVHQESKKDVWPEWSMVCPWLPVFCWTENHVTWHNCLFTLLNCLFGNIWKDYDVYDVIMISPNCHETYS